MSTDPARPDRVNEYVTTLFDAAAVVLFAAAAGLAGWTYGPAWSAPAAAAVVLFTCSLLAQFRGRPREVRPPAAEGPPGPADPGNLHVMGR